MVSLGPVRGQESREWAEAALWGPGVETTDGVSTATWRDRQPCPFHCGCRESRPAAVGSRSWGNLLVVSETTSGGRGVQLVLQTLQFFKKSFKHRIFWTICPVESPTFWILWIAFLWSHIICFSLSCIFLKTASLI